MSFSSPEEDKGADLLQKYKSITQEFLTTPEQIRSVFNDANHAFYGELATLLKEASEEEMQHILNKAHAEAYQYTIPVGVTRRAHPKAAPRVQKKMAQFAGRSAFADWIACRLEGEYATFALTRSKFQESLPQDAIVVWRNDYENEPDIVQYGYAYLPGSLAIMEIQIVEPIAAWVFRSNSQNKHAGNVAYVTFKESQELYASVKEAILADEPLNFSNSDVVQYFEKARQASGGDPALLDKEELGELQRLLGERFGAHNGKD